MGVLIIPVRRMIVIRMAMVRRGAIEPRVLIASMVLAPGIVLHPVMPVVVMPVVIQAIVRGRLILIPSTSGLGLTERVRQTCRTSQPDERRDDASGKKPSRRPAIDLGRPAERP